jgi:hypothetical protein
MIHSSLACSRKKYLSLQSKEHEDLPHELVINYSLELKLHPVLEDNTNDTK